MLHLKLGGKRRFSAEYSGRRFVQLPSATDRPSLADEQAALRREASLRRIATLVAGGVTAEDLFSAVACEVSVVLDVPVVTVGRYELDSGLPVSVVLASRAHASFPVGSRWPLDGAGTREIYENRRPTRIEDFAGLEGDLAAAARQQGMSWVVGAPIIVDGAVWGNIYAGTAGEEPIPEDAESRLADFTDLVSTAIASSDAREEVGRLLDEQAALRRVATLVAEGGAADDLFAAVAREVADLFGAGMVNIDRYENGESVVLASFDDPQFPWPPIIASRRRMWRVGSRWPLGGPGLRTQVYETGRSVREDAVEFVAGSPPALAQAWGNRSGVAVPIVVDGNVWGVLGIASKEDAPLPADTERRLAAFTELVATAIANTESRAELAASEARARELAEEQAALRRVAALVAGGASSSAVFDAVAQEVAQLVQFTPTLVARYENDGATLTVLAICGPHPASFAPGSRWPLDGPTVAAEVLRTGRPVRIEDYTDLSGTLAHEAREHGWTKTAGAPIIVDGRVWGLVAASGPPDERLPENLEDRLAEFTQLVATAIANAESRGQLAASEARARELATEQAALRRVATLVAENASAEKLLSAVAEEVARVLAAPEVTIDRFDEDGSATTVVASWCTHTAWPVGSRWPLDGPSLAATIWKTGRPARIDDYTGLSGTIAAALRDRPKVRGVGVPIIVGNRLWGMIGAGPMEDHAPGAVAKRLARFTELVATAIANSESRSELAASEARARELADEQASLRRVATLVAQGASADELFSAVSKEVAGVVDVPVVSISRYEADGTFTILGNAGEVTSLWIGTRWPVWGIAETALATGRPSRQDDFTTMPGPVGDPVRDALILSWQEPRSVVGVPIVVEGGIWGLMFAAAEPGSEPIPAGTEERLARFTELVATAVSNATTRSELLASRARLVSTADESRRRLERDLHDGIQQWLVSLALRARKAAGLAVADESASQELSGLADDLVAVTDELREISRGIHPAILSDAGLDDALEALARRSTIRVDLDVSFQGRYEPTLEATVYYVAAESITNAVKHAQASTVTVRGGLRDGVVELEITDDGVGGADPSRGTGLIGLKDRVDTLGGTISFASPPGVGTTIRARLPADPRV
jgi:signal transduction histidine kinase